MQKKWWYVLEIFRSGSKTTEVKEITVDSDFPFSSFHIGDTIKIKREPGTSWEQIKSEPEIFTVKGIEHRIWETDTMNHKILLYTD